MRLTSVPQLMMFRTGIVLPKQTSGAPVPLCYLNFVRVHQRGLNGAFFIFSFNDSRSYEGSTLWLFSQTPLEGQSLRSPWRLFRRKPCRSPQRSIAGHSGSWSSLFGDHHRFDEVHNLFILRGVLKIYNGRKYEF